MIRSHLVPILTVLVSLTACESVQVGGSSYDDGRIVAPGEAPTVDPDVIDPVTGEPVEPHQTGRVLFSGSTGPGSGRKTSVTDL